MQNGEPPPAGSILTKTKTNWSELVYKRQLKQVISPKAGAANKKEEENNGGVVMQNRKLGKSLQERNVITVGKHNTFNY